MEQFDYTAGRPVLECLSSKRRCVSSYEDTPRPNEDVCLEDTPEKMYNVVSLKRIVKCIFGYSVSLELWTRGWPKSGGVPVLVADPRFAWSSRKGSFAIMQCAVSSAHRALRLVPI